MPSNLGAAIKKSKKKAHKPSLLDGVEEIEYKPMKGAMEVEYKPMEGAKKSKFEAGIKSKVDSSDLSKLELMLSSSKKKAKPEANAYDPEVGEFKVEKDDKGMWKESGESAKKRYLEKLKSRKGM